MSSLKDTLTKGMVSLKKKPEPAKEKALDGPCEDPYPYGTRLELRKAQIEALGLKLEELEVGGEMTVVATAKVVSMRKSEGLDNYSQELGLQLTDMKIE